MYGLAGQPTFANFTEDFKVATTCVVTGAGGYKADRCDVARWLLPASVIVGAMQLHAQVLLSKHDTGMFATLTLNIAPFLSDAVFASRSIMGSAFVYDASLLDIGAAICSSVGTVAFWFFDRRRCDRALGDNVENSRFITWAIASDSLW